jgi:pimeloyl-ACP methyl ester carboxylesterase/UDP:flavonoid glycosyltransferase YjiC (YdhE family)
LGREQNRIAMRAVEPEFQGSVEVGGVGIGYEVFGSGPQTILLVPPWAIVSSRVYKGQVPYLARHFRVITFDPRGNGRSERPPDPAAYGGLADVEIALAVLDATGTERAVVAGLSTGGTTAVFFASRHPERVAGVVAIAPSVPALTPPPPWQRHSFEDDFGLDEGWPRFNRHSWRRDYPGFLDFFFREMFQEPHSEKQIEDCIGWGLDIGEAALEHTMDAPPAYETREEAEALVAGARCPVLVIHGDLDRITALERGRRVAELTGGDLIVLEGSGHGPNARDPVKVNALIRDFATRALGAPVVAERRWTRAPVRGPRALLVSSPIGLGHARRDIAIARELRRLVPRLEIDWLAQHPLTAALEAAGERVHPASRHLASESGHLEAAAGPHTLNVFQAIREMDEILLANYMVFRDLTREQPYDVWIGDEAWDVDHFLHENPEDKRAPFVFLTDFVGWLPLPEGGEREAFLTADLNEQMLEQVGRFPHVRDRALFVGDADDVVPGSFGPGLPEIREWVERHFEFCGQVIDPLARPATGERNGDGPLCVAAVGGSAVGAGLLGRLVAGYEAAAGRVPGLRMVAVAGPRVDRERLRAPAGVEVRGYVPDLDRVLAACDVALVQGGLSTGMELVAAGTPFVSFPLKRHFEQRIHVAHRLARHGHTRALELEDATPDGVGEAIAGALSTAPDYRAVAPGGAARAAARIAELL